MTATVPADEPAVLLTAEQCAQLGITEDDAARAAEWARAHAYLIDQEPEYLRRLLHPRSHGS